MCGQNSNNSAVSFFPFCRTFNISTNNWVAACRLIYIRVVVGQWTLQAYMRIGQREGNKLDDDLQLCLLAPAAKRIELEFTLFLE